MFSHKRHTATIAAAASVLLMAGAQAADVAKTQLVLTAYTNGAGGESLTSGKYDAAFAEIQADRTYSSWEYSAKMNNLCVAHAAMKQITQARSACDAAVKAAKYEKLTAQRYSPGSSRENAYVALAYANRAVVHMMAKDSASAKSDLARAKSLAPTAEFVSKNLAAVQNTRSTIAQLEVAPSR